VNYARDKKDAEKVVGAIEKAGETTITVQADVSKQTDVDRLFEEDVRHSRRARHWASKARTQS
jgi:3-oxoacyl-[acyl-carrier protein] reductase